LERLRTKALEKDMIASWSLLEVKIVHICYTYLYEY